MSNVKVKFLQTAAGAYGVARAGDEVVVKASDAKELEKAGIVEVGKETSDDISVPASGSVRIADETGKTAVPAGDTNEKNVTGPDKPVGKALPPKTGAKETGKK